MLRHSLTQRVRSTVLAVTLVCLLLTPVRGLAVTGSAVALAWDPSPDTSVVGYNVYYGTASRSYTNMIPAGDGTNSVVSNLVAGVTYYFAATTFSAAGLESDYSTEASYAVPSVGPPANTPPTLGQISNLTIAQDSGQQIVQLTGISSGSTNEIQTLSVNAFSSNPALIPNPVVTYTSPDNTGSLSFSPNPGSFGSTILTVLVDDGGLVSNTVIGTFVVDVVPIENPPTIDPVKDLVLSQNAGTQSVALTGITAGWTNSTQALMVTAVSSNPSLIPNPGVSYSTPSTSGSLSFAPVTNAFGVATISVTVSDAQPTNNTTSISFVVTVNQPVAAPGVLTNFSVAPNTTLRYVVPTPATNGDKFSISLAAGAPAGAKMATRKGLSWLVWTPTTAQASTTNVIVFKVNDQSTPALSTNYTVLVNVQDYASLVVGSTSVQSGQNGSVPLAVSSSEGVTNLSFTIPWPATALTAPTLSTSIFGVAASSLKVQGTNLLVSLQMASGHVLTGSNIFGSIHFQSASTAPSEYLSLPVSSMVAYKPGTQYVNSFPTAGQVAVVNSLAMLQASTTGTAGRTLTVLGKTGVNYQVQYCTNFAGRGNWYPLTSYMQTNIVQVISVDPSLFHAYYRVQQQ
jgi:hypothetical protein